MSKEALFLREWCALITALFLFVGLTCTTSRGEVGGVVDRGNPPLIQITIRGAVLRPGDYLVRPGLLVKDLLVQAGRMKEADLSRLSLKRPLCNEETIDVPLREKKKLRYAPRSKVEQKA